MDLLLDPKFKYPDLVTTTEAMIAGTMSPARGLALARSVTGGEVRDTSVGTARVIGPQGRASEVLAELHQYINRHDQRSVERWAAFALMVEAQLGTGDLDPDAAGLGLTTAVQMVDACVKATGARCPARAVRFVVAVLDSMLASPACDAPLRNRLQAIRARFSTNAASA